MKALLAKHGWKSYLGALIVGVVAVLRYSEVIDQEAAEMFLRLGEALLGIGLAHKFVKMSDPE